MRHTAPLVFLVEFDGGEYVYRVRPIHVQSVTDPVIMPAKEEHGYDSGSESLTNKSYVKSYIFMLKDVIEVSLL